MSLNNGSGHSPFMGSKFAWIQVLPRRRMSLHSLHVRSSARCTPTIQLSNKSQRRWSCLIVTWDSAAKQDPHRLTMMIMMIMSVTRGTFLCWKDKCLFWIWWNCTFFTSISYVKPQEISVWTWRLDHHRHFSSHVATPPTGTLPSERPETQTPGRLGNQTNLDGWGVLGSHEDMAGWWFHCFLYTYTYI